MPAAEVDITPYSSPPGDGTFTQATVAGQPVWQNTGNSYFLYCRRPDSFAFTVGQTLYVRVTYFDDIGGNVGLQFDAQTNSFKASTLSSRTTRVNTQKFVNGYFELRDVRFDKRANGADFRVSIGGAAVSRITLSDTPFADPDFQLALSRAWKTRYTGPAKNYIDTTTLKGKVMTGYQGWFGAPNDFANTGGWGHWARATPLIPENFATDAWPDLTEYDPASLFRAADVVTRSGAPAYLFSSQSYSTVQKHFRWMRKHNIDGAFVQRFHPQAGAQPEWVLRHVTQAAAEEGLIWAVEYDVSGMADATVAAKLQADWEWLTTQFDLLNDPRYAREGGKPVVFIWGFAFPDRNFTTASANTAVDYFKAQGAHVIGAMRADWKALAAPWQTHLQKYDGLLVWQGYDRSDATLIRNRGQDYYPHVFPGFSWANLQRQPATPPSDLIDRSAGEWYWDQARDWINAGDADRLFVGMFDEYDEATHVMPMTDDPPNPSATHGRFLDNQGKPSDWWMTLTDQLKRLMLDQRTDSTTQPAVAALANRSNIGAEASVDLGTTDLVSSLSRVENSGDGATIVETVGGRECRGNATPTSSHMHLYYNINDAFAFQLANGDVTVEVEYFDSFYGSGAGTMLGLQYDSASTAYTNHPQSITTTNSGTWRTVRFEIADAWFGGRQNNSADFRLMCNGRKLNVNRVWVRLPEGKAHPFTWTNATAGPLLNWSQNANWLGGIIGQSDPTSIVRLFPGQTMSGGAIPISNNLTGQQLGTLALGGIASASSDTTVTLSGNAISLGGAVPSITLQATRGSFNFTYDLAAPLTLGSTGQVSGDGDATFRISGPVSGPGGFTKTGVATLTLEGTNTYTGPTTITNGTLALVGGSQASPITVGTGAFLGFTPGSPTSSTAAVTFNAGSAVRITGTPILASNTLMTAASFAGIAPVPDSPVPGYQLLVDGGNTLKLVRVTDGILHGANLLSNDSFESGTTTPTSWNVGGPASRSTTRAQGPGTASLKISGGSAIASQTIAVEANTTYNVSVWIHASELLTGIVVFDLNDRPTPQAEVQFVMYGPNAGWQLYSGTVNTGAETSITPRMFSSSNMTGNVYFDNVLFEKIDTSGNIPTLGKLFTSNMVLQRGQNVAVYGTAPPGIEVTLSFAGQTKMVTADQNGKWSVTLDPMLASFTKRTLTVSSSFGSRSINNVLVGDVWLASGQSNMDHPFSSYNQLTTTGKDNPNIRLLMSAHNPSATPQDVPVLDASHNDSWQECTATYLNSFSPVAYFYGAKLQTDLNVPIGLIESALGGTIAEAWTPASKMLELGYPVVDPGTIDNNDQSVLYNGMIHPFRDFTFKGVIWYQGESNSSRAMEYQTLFSGMIESWRAAFGRGNIPFYFVQLAPYGITTSELEGQSWAWLREAQTRTLSVPNTGMAVITDMGEYIDIHPQNKKPVGERLALHALKAEGINVIADSPIYSGMTKNGNQITVSFVNANSGLKTQEVRMNKNPYFLPGTDSQAYVAPASTVAGFKICGADRIFVNANAVISGNQVIVSSPAVSNPIAVRYAWENFPLCNLYSMEGLPVNPFHTDSFDPRSIGDIYSGNASDYGQAGVINATTTESLVTSTSVAGIAGHLIDINPGGGTRFGYYRTLNTALKNGATPYQVVQVLYYDQGNSSFSMLYDATSGPWKTSQLTVNMTNSLQWRVATAYMSDAYFGGRCNGSDVRLEFNAPTTIGGVFFSALQGGSAYYDWAVTNFLLKERQSEDTDLDGLSNFLEYALDGNPQLNDSASKLPQISKNGASMNFVFKRAQSTLTYGVEKSTNLVDWNHYVTVTNTHGTVGNTAAVTVPDTEMSNGKLFLRLKVE